jgi:hypothetical protein
LFDALLSVTNEYEEIVSFQLSLGTGKDVQRPFWDGIVKSLESMGSEQPRVVYTDQCCHDRSFFEDVFPSLKKDVVVHEAGKLPYLTLNCDPVLVDSNVMADHISEQLDGKITVTEEKHIGFDCEWNVDLKANGPGPVSTIQLAFGNQVYVFHLPSCATRAASSQLKGILPSSLTQILQRPDILLIGRQVGGDIAKLMRDYEVRITAERIELGSLARRKHAVKDGRSSLREISRAVLFLDIKKDQRLSDWSSALHQDQVTYAALDAYASLLIYQKLAHLVNVGEAVNSVNIRDGLYVSINVGTVLVGYGEILLRNENNNKFVSIRILDIVAPGVRVKPKTGPPATLSELKDRHPDHVSLNTKLLLTASRPDTPRSVSSCDTIQQIRDGIYTVHTRVKLDPSHWFSRISSSLDSGHGLHVDFCRALRDAVFIMDTGDKELITMYLNSIGQDFEERLDNDSEFILRHVRRTIPQPPVLRARIMNVVDRFRGATDATTNLPLLPPGFDKIMNNALVHVDKGCLSDPTDVQLYHQLPKKTVHGFPAYRCSRGTNSNEGTVHQKLIPRFGAQNAGARLSYYMLLDFAVINNMKASVRNKGQLDFGHKDPWLLDELSVVLQKFDGSSFNEWLPTSAISVNDFPFMITQVPNLPPFSNEYAVQIKMEPSLKFIAKKMNVKIPVLPIHTKEEMALFKRLHGTGITAVIDQWNVKADGIAIFYKLPNLLIRYETTRMKAENRKATQLTNNVSRRQVEHPHAFVLPHNITEIDQLQVDNMQDVLDDGINDNNEFTILSADSVGQPQPGPSVVNKRKRVVSPMSSGAETLIVDPSPIALPLAIDTQMERNTVNNITIVAESSTVPLETNAMETDDHTNVEAEVVVPTAQGDNGENIPPQKPKSVRQICEHVVAYIHATESQNNKGQRKASSEVGVPRTTVKRWRTKLEVLGYSTVAKIEELGKSDKGSMTLRSFEKSKAQN